ncbi:hypothetical protein [Desulfacinum hydrothermale]|nr:hypothetical protein [Desulfacinum hydrothermale]
MVHESEEIGTGSAVVKVIVGLFESEALSIGGSRWRDASKR